MRARLPGGLEVSFLQMLLVAGIVFYSLAVPGDLRFKMAALGFGVCHQIADHSYFIDDHQLPLCSRCSGIYLGALSAFLLLAVLRRRATGLPAAPVAAILAVFFGAMLLDGVNSTLQTFNSGIWDSTNMIRLFTGGLAGIAVASVVYPMFNLSLWHPEVARRDHAVEQPFELAAYLVAAGVLVALVLDGGLNGVSQNRLYYPLSILSVAGMLTLLTTANAMLVLVVTRREAHYRTISEALTPVLLGLCLSLIELTLLALARTSLAPYLGDTLGMPLAPGLP